MKMMPWAIAALLLLCAPASSADKEPADDAKDGNSDAEAPPEPRASVTQHQARIGGQSIRYTATAGWLIMKDKKDKPTARFGYTAYTREGVEDPARRPVTFAFNGGPGSASIWLHMGILGPRRVVVTDAGFTPPPPVELADNPWSVLDETDIVLLDPVGTGYSKPLGKSKSEDFHGVDQDIRSVADFIVQYTTVNGRWRSPKYILGESYGGVRAAGLVYALQSSHGMAFNGVVLVSPFLHFASGVDGVGVDLPHALYLPALAATAWYHDALVDKPPDLGRFLDEVERFAMDEYMPALMRGYTLTEDEQRALADRLAGYTGTDADYWLRADLRVSHGQFLQELDRDARRIAGRIDSRFVGPALNPLAETMDYDPFFPSVGPAFTAAFRDYYRRELELEVDDDYVVSGGFFQEWDWKHRQPDSPGFALPSPNTLPDLAHAMTMNPGLGVLVQQGYFDLATPYFASEYDLLHLDVGPEARERIRFEYYEAGHMMYLHRPSAEKYREDLVRFIRATSRLGDGE